MIDIRHNPALARRRLVPVSVSLLIAGVIYLSTGKINLDPVNSKYRDGSGFYIGGYRLGGWEDVISNVSHSEASDASDARQASHFDAKTKNDTNQSRSQPTSTHSNPFVED